MGAVDAIKGLGDLIKTIQQAEIKVVLTEKYMDAQSACLALQEKVSTLLEQNEALKREIEVFKKRDDIRGKLKRVRDAYWLTDSLGERPICPACFEERDRTIPLVQIASFSESGICPTCHTKYLSVFEVPPDADLPIG